MSRRKQENPQPRKRLVTQEEIGGTDLLVCGVCLKEFFLSDIVKFIQHKVHLCNKENVLLYNKDCSPDADSGALTASASTRTSINAPIGSKSSQPVDKSRRLSVGSDENDRSSRGPSSPSRASPDEHNPVTPNKPKQVDAEANTTITEPSNYICAHGGCKQQFDSAWSLVQHVQNCHRVKIYVDRNAQLSSPVKSSPPSSAQPSLMVPPPHVSVPLSLEPPPPPFLMRLPDRHPLSSAANHHTPFSRPSSHHEFRMELMNEALHRLNPHFALPSLEPPFSVERPLPYERPPHPPVAPPPPPSLTRQQSLEGIDFYSQRLRQLAGTTTSPPSQGTSPSPRKYTPPFSQGPHSVSQSPTLRTTPSTTPTPAQSTSSHLSAKHKSCEFCGKNFRFQSNLIVHRRSHTGEKPFKCHICNHACTQASKLKRHLKTHQNKSPGSMLSEDAASRVSSNSTPESGGKSDSKDEDEDSLMAGEDDEDKDDDVDEDDPMEEEDYAAEIALARASESGAASTESRQSVLEAVMQDIGLNNIPQYNEAYRAAKDENIKLKEEISENGMDSEQKVEDSDEKDRKSSTPEKEMPGLSHSAHCSSEHPVTAHHETGGSSRGNDINHMQKIKLEYPDPPRPADMADIFRNSLSWYQRDMLNFGPSLPGPGVLNFTKHSKPPIESALNRDNLAGASSLLSAGSPRPKDKSKNDTCEYCGKVFKNCSNLTVHRRSHTGEKPYKCQLCSYACAQSSKLTRHMKTHGRIGKDVFRCRFCDMPFSVPSTLEKHMRKCVVSQKALASAMASSGHSGLNLSMSDNDSKDSNKERMTPT